MSKRRLGKGIDALLQGRPLEQLSRMSSILMVDVDRILPNPDQPRRRFRDDTLAELAASIRERGIIQPIIAEDRGDGTYTIVAGERRFRAAKIAGLGEIPVISQDFTDDEKLEIALIENIQREDLNPIDEARAMHAAMERAGVTQEQLAGRLGKSRSAIANALRLLRLDDDVQQALADGAVTPGHARALLALEHEADRRELFDRIRAEGLSVRQAELAVRHRLSADAAGSGDDVPGGDGSDAAEDPALGADAAGAFQAHGSYTHDVPGHDNGHTAPPSGPRRDTRSVELRRIEDRLVEHLGTRVVVRGDNARGRIDVSYLSAEDLERVLEAMGLTPE